MDSDDIPEEYIDNLVQEFAYDPIRLDVKEDPAQVLYNRMTLERISDMNHDAVNPYTRQPFDINNVVPQSKLGEQMSHYILNNPTLGLEVIPDYTKVLSTGYMKILLIDTSLHYDNLVDYYNPISNADDAGNERWKILWQKLNLVRLYCQYSEENKETFLSINGYEYLFHVVEEHLRYLWNYYYSSCEYAKEVCTEIAKIVDLIGFRRQDLISISHGSLRAFARILYDLADSEYLKIQSMVLRIYLRLFYDCIFYDIAEFQDLRFYVVKVALYLLWRENSRDITNEDLYNGMKILSVAWIKHQFYILTFEYSVDVLVNVVVICIARLQDLNEVVAVDDGDSVSIFNITNNDIRFLSFALTEGLRSIQTLVTDDSNYFSEKERLKSLDIIKEVVRIVELVVAGFKIFEPIHLRYGLRIVEALYKQYGFNVIRRKDVEIFGKLLESDIVNEYGEDIKILLQRISGAEFQITTFYV